MPEIEGITIDSRSSETRNRVEGCSYFFSTQAAVVPLLYRNWYQFSDTLIRPALGPSGQPLADFQRLVKFSVLTISQPFVNN